MTKREKAEQMIQEFQNKILAKCQLTEEDMNRIVIMHFLYSCGRINLYQIIVRLTDIARTCTNYETYELVEMLEGDF